LEVCNGNDDLEKALRGDSDGVEEQLLSAKRRAQRAAGGSSTTGLLWTLEIRGKEGKMGGVSARGRGGNRGSGRLDAFSGFDNVQSRRRINE
jgi:hypothetical protein